MNKETEAIELLEDATEMSKRGRVYKGDYWHDKMEEKLDQALTKLREAPRQSDKPFLICLNCGKTFPLFMEIEFGSHIAGCKAPEPPEPIKEVIAILDKEEYLTDGVYKKTEGVEQAMAKLREVPEQPLASKFTKEIKSTGLMEYKSDKHSIIKLKEACNIIDQLQVRLDTSEAARKDLREALEKYGDHEPGCTKGTDCICGFEAAIAKEKKG